MLNDTFDFVNRISKVKIGKGQWIVSFDIVSFFTNIPTLETIEIIVDMAFDGVELFHGMEKDDLRKLLRICVQESHFQFDGNYYEQIDGVSMGSPLGPLFANIFMSWFVKRYMNELKNLGVESWSRFVDDTFVILKSRKDAEIVLKFLNTKHPNIKFTMEEEKSGCIPFLDVLAKRKGDQITSIVYAHRCIFGLDESD